MIHLKTYQQKALTKSDKRNAFAFLMPPGSGKTITLLEEVKCLYRDKAIDTLIVVCPKILMRQWEKAIEEYYNDRSDVVSLDDDTSSTRSSNYFPASHISYNIVVYKNYLKKYSTLHGCLNIVISNIESFSREKSKSILLVGKLLANRKCLLCIDESSKIKNHKAALTKNLLEVVDNKKCFRRILTGSVITESPMDFYTQFRFLDPEIIGHRNFYIFRHYYAELEDAYVGTGVFKKIKSYRHVDELVSKITPYCYLLDVDDIKELPSKIYENVYIDINPEQRRQYEKLKKESILELEKEPNVELNIVSAMDKLFKFFRILQGHYLETGVVNPKITALKELIDIYPGKFLIFCRFIDDSHRIAEALDSVAVIRGDVPNKERMSIIEDYKSGKVKHLVSMQQIGSFGLDLPETDYVAYFSCNYSYDQRMQSEARATRLSSNKPSITYFNIVAENTIEEHLYEILKSKKTMFVNILNLLKQE